MQRLMFTVLLLSGLACADSHAKQLDDYLALLDTHPKVMALLAQHEAQNHQADGAMGLPDPSLFLGVDNVPVSDPSFDRFLPTSKVIGFSQTLPGSRGRKAQRGLFLATAATSEILADHTRSRLHALFFTRLADLQRVGQQIGYEERKKEVIAELQDYYEGQIVAGEPAYQKTFTTDIELAGVEQRLNTLQAEKTLIEADLVQLVDEVPDLTPPPLIEKAWDGDPTALYPVLLASRSIAVETAQVELADSDYSPDFGLTGTYKFREDGANGSFDGEDWFSLQFRISIPLWAATNQRPKVEAARSRKKGAEFEYRETVRRWRMETTRLMGEIRASAQNIEVLKKKDEALGRNITAMERTYSTGQTSLEPVLQAELARLTLLSQIAGEQQRHVTLAEELNAHIIPRDHHETK